MALPRKTRRVLNPVDKQFSVRLSEGEYGRLKQRAQRNGIALALQARLDIEDASRLGNLPEHADVPETPEGTA